MKGIILSGGSGTRLYPLTKVMSKQLMPVYDKPMIYYPLSVLMQANIREILIISTPEDIGRFQKLFGNGQDIGIEIQYKIQPNPDGIAQAFILGKEFIGNEDACLILGDNIFYGQDLPSLLLSAVHNASNKKVATVFGYHVNDPERYGVVEFDDKGNALSIEEKPAKPKSNYAVTGLYFYPNDVIKNVLHVSPSNRGELEITSLNQLYLENDRLKVKILDRGSAWLDTGTHESLMQASSFIEIIEKRQGLKIACIEEIAFNKGFINLSQLKILAKRLANNQYGEYLLKILGDHL